MFTQPEISSRSELHSPDIPVTLPATLLLSSLSPPSNNSSGHDNDFCYLQKVENQTCLHKGELNYLVRDLCLSNQLKFWVLIWKRKDASSRYKILLAWTREEELCQYFVEDDPIVYYKILKVYYQNMELYNKIQQDCIKVIQQDWVEVIYRFYHQKSQGRIFYTLAISVLLYW